MDGIVLWPDWPYEFRTWEPRGSVLGSDIPREVSTTAPPHELGRSAGELPVPNEDLGVPHRPLPVAVAEAERSVSVLVGPSPIPDL